MLHFAHLDAKKIIFPFEFTDENLKQQISVTSLTLALLIMQRTPFVSIIFFPSIEST